VRTVCVAAGGSVTAKLVVDRPHFKVYRDVPDPTPPASKRCRSNRKKATMTAPSGPAVPNGPYGPNTPEGPAGPASPGDE
jgi:hypothetical protein